MIGHLRGPRYVRLPGRFCGRRPRRSWTASAAAPGLALPLGLALALGLSLAAAPASGSTTPEPSPSSTWPSPGNAAKPATPLPITGELRTLRLVHVPLSAGGGDSGDLSVPAAQSAPPATHGQAPEGSLAGTERTLTVGSGKKAQTWLIRLDVTGVTAIGSTMISIQTEAKVISGPAGETFRNYNTLFSGNSPADDTHATAIYDRSAGQALQVVIDSAGDMVRSDHNTYIDPGVTVTDWEMYPRPADMATAQIQYYIPGLGILTIPVPR